MFLVYPSYTEIQQIWSYIDIEIICLKELLVTQKIIRTRRVQGVNIWCVAARKLCLIVDSQVMIWSCTLSYKNSHQQFYAFNTILVRFLTIFAKFKYELDFNNFAITLQPSRNKELCPFPILIEKYRVLQLLWCEKSQSSWRSFHVFPYKILICYFSIWLKEQRQQLITYYKLIELFLIDFLINLRN